MQSLLGTAAVVDYLGVVETSSLIHDFSPFATSGSDPAPMDSGRDAATRMVPQPRPWLVRRLCLSVWGSILDDAGYVWLATLSDRRGLWSDQRFIIQASGDGSRGGGGGKVAGRAESFFTSSAWLHEFQQRDRTNLARANRGRKDVRGHAVLSDLAYPYLMGGENRPIIQN